MPADDVPVLLISMKIFQAEMATLPYATHPRYHGKIQSSINKNIQYLGMYMYESLQHIRYNR